jgi:hypothetical protein
MKILLVILFRKLVPAFKKSFRQPPVPSRIVPEENPPDIMKIVPEACNDAIRYTLEKKNNGQ